MVLLIYKGMITKGDVDKYREGCNPFMRLTEAEKSIMDDVLLIISGQQFYEWENSPDELQTVY